MEKVHEIAIVGGGIAGLYSAMRLIEEKLFFNIVVYEKSSRFGGKVKSETLEDGVLEHGAWRISPEHTLVNGMISEFRLAKFPYPATQSHNTTKQHKTTEERGYLSKFAKWLFKYSPIDAVVNDLQSGYADASSGADVGERHGGEYFGIVEGYDKVIKHLMIKIEKLCSEKGAQVKLINQAKVTRIRRCEGGFKFTVTRENKKENKSEFVSQKKKAKIVIFACSPNHASNMSYGSVQEDLRILKSSIVPLPLCRVYRHSKHKQTPKDEISNTACHRQIMRGHWNIASYTSGRIANAWRDLFVYNNAEDYLPNSKYFYWPEGTHLWKPSFRFDQARQAQLAVRIHDNLFIVGEALSDCQGWLEGALRSVEQLISIMKNGKFKSSKKCTKCVFYRGRKINLDEWAQRHPGGADFIKNLRNGEHIDEIFDRVHLSEEPFKQLFALQDE